MHELLEHADVVVCGYRPGALDRFGIADDGLIERYPGLVIVELQRVGTHRPWAERRGFDSVVQAPTGIAASESADGETPGALPCKLLEHGTGYLASGGGYHGVRRQSADRRDACATTVVRPEPQPGSPHAHPPTRRTPDSVDDDPRPWLQVLHMADDPIDTVRPRGRLRRP